MGDDACQARVVRAMLHGAGMLGANVHPAIVQQRLGHSTIATTVDLYSHVTPGLQARAAERFDEAFGRSVPAVPAEVTGNSATL